MLKCPSLLQAVAEDPHLRIERKNGQDRWHYKNNELRAYGGLSLQEDYNRMRKEELNPTRASRDREHATNVISLPFENDRFESDDDDDVEGVRVSTVRATDATYFQTYVKEYRAMTEMGVEEDLAREIAMSVAKDARVNEVERSKRAPRAKPYDRNKEKKEPVVDHKEPDGGKFRALPQLKERVQIPDARAKDVFTPERERYRWVSKVENPNDIASVSERIMKTQIPLSVGEILSISRGVQDDMKGRISKEKVPRDQDVQMKVSRLEDETDTDEDLVRIHNMRGDSSEELTIIEPLPFVIIELLGPNGEPNKVEALVDTGSQLNVMSYSTWLSTGADKGDMDMWISGFNDSGANTNGVCPSMEFKIGTVTNKAHFCIMEDSGTPLILGRPWWIRYVDTWKNHKNGGSLKIIDHANHGKFTEVSVLARKKHRKFLAQVEHARTRTNVVRVDLSKPDSSPTTVRPEGAVGLARYIPVDAKEELTRQASIDIGPSINVMSKRDWDDLVVQQRDEKGSPEPDSSSAIRRSIHLWRYSTTNGDRRSRHRSIPHSSTGRTYQRTRARHG